MDWILSNKTQFGSNALGTCLGFFSENGNVAYIYPSMLTQALVKAQYSPKKTMKYLSEQGLIGTYTVPKTCTKRLQVPRNIGGRTTWFVEFHIGSVAENTDPIEAKEDELERRDHYRWGQPRKQEQQQTRQQPQEQWEQQGFTELEDADPDELPF